MLEVCSSIGFDAVSIESVESENEPPKVCITFRQERIAETPAKPEEKRDVISGRVIEDDSETLLDGSKL